jgi:hypothetical protein
MDKIVSRKSDLLLVLLAIIAILAFILITNTFSFKDRLLNILYPKPQANAQVNDAFLVTDPNGSPLPQPTADTFITNSLDVQIKLKDVNVLNQ